MSQTSMFKGAHTGAADNHANRGMAFEEALRWQHAMYLRRGAAKVDKQYIPSLPVRDGKWAKVIGKSTVDFVGVLRGGLHVAFDAKDCAGKRIELDRLQPHQMEHLEDVEREGGLAFVLVRFERQRVYMIPMTAWRWAVEAHRAGHSVYVEGIDWAATGKASLNEKDMRKEWLLDGVDWEPAARRYDFDRAAGAKDG
jgi:recombination protein U